MSGDPLTERLKEQVSASIQDALSKATSVLSNLHRVQSYLDVLASLPVSRAGDVIKNAVEQVKGMRADAATLLQTVYLTEIGLQSLQELDKGSGGLFGDGPSDVQTDMSFISSVSTELAPAPGPNEEEEPLPKKLKLGVAITSCVSCNRKFAHQSSTDDSTLCRACRDESLHQSSLSQPHTEPISKGTPRKKRKSSLAPQKCTLCGTSFVYRRCLLRHIKENHPDSDKDNPQQYIESSTAVSESLSAGRASEVHVLSSEDSIVEHVMGGITPSSVHVTIDSEESAHDSTASLLTTPTSEATQEESGVENYDSIEKMEDGKCAVVTRNGEKLYKCLLCSKSFTRPYRIQRHLQVHNPSRHKVQCHLCDKYFTRVDTLQTHIRCVHTNERPYACTFEGCDKRFPVQSGLVHHLKSHMDGKPYKCPECQATFALMAEFKGHMSSEHAANKDRRCLDCYKLFPSSLELEQHRALEHRLECEICNKTFARLGFLQAHVEIHSGPSLYNCRFCNSGFDNEYSYKQHVKSHPKYNRVRRTHPCPVCGDSFLDSNDLMLHYQSEDHRDKVKSLGLNNSMLNTQELSRGLAGVAGDLSEEDLIQSISESDAFQAALSAASGEAGTKDMD